MKYDVPKSIILILLLMIVSSVPEDLYAQKSAAELISTMPPPKGKIKYKDGIRHIAVKDHYLFVTNIWAGLQVVDISDMQNPEQIAFLPSDDEAFNTYVEGDYAYLANHSSGVQVYDIGDMNQISLAAHINSPGNALWVVAEYPNLFVALGEDGFAIMDISDLSRPITIKLEIPGDWVQQIFKKDNLLFLAVKTGGLLIYDISDMERPQLLSQFRTGYNSMMVQVVDDVAYIADGAGGMLILDVAKPRFPKQIRRYHDVGFVGSLYKAGNYVYLANRDVGLQIINVTDLSKPFLESRYTTNDIAYGVYKKDIYVFLAANTATLLMRHNNAPQLAVVGDQQLKENAPFTLQLTAHEPDGDALVYHAVNLPEGASINEQTGLITWVPGYEQSGVYKNIILSVVEQTDSRLSAADTISLFVDHVNRPPDLPAVENQTVDENSLLTFTVPEGSDPDKEDQDRLSYRAEKLPEGATFDPDSLEFTWTPTFEQSGIYVIDFLIDDGAGGIDREPATITVNHIDRKPAIDPIAQQSIAEGQTLAIELTGTEPDREDLNKISYVMQNLPDGASFDPSTRLFTWSPGYDQSGVYNEIQAIMIGGKLSDTTTFSITVNHVNRPPVLTAIPDQTVDENQMLAFTIVGSDPDVEDAGKLAYSAANLPPGALFDPDSLAFRWKPDYEQSGQYPEVTFTVTDPSGLSDSKSITISVNHVNRPPQITAVENKIVNENEHLEFQLTASDPDREDVEKLNFSAVGLPEGAALNAKTGIFQWTPTYEQSGEYELSLVISDGEYTDSTPLSITVQHVNRPPVLAAIETKTVDENQPLTFTINGSDPDREDEGLLSYTVQNLPDGAAFDAAARSFSWTPTYEQSGQYTVSFSVSDPAGLTGRDSVNITVNHVNRPPTLEAIVPQTVDENQPLTVQLNGKDPDREDAGKLLYEVDNLPEGAQFDPAAGTLSWTPSFDQSGEHELNARVKDSAGLAASQGLSITVNNVNRAPEFEILPAQNGQENSSLQFVLQASDPDREDVGKLSYLGKNLPVGATINENSGEFTWTPNYEQSGEYKLSFQVTDSFGATDALEVAVNIAHVNRPPTLPAIADATFPENSAGRLTLPEGQDPDNEDAGQLTYSLGELPAGATFNPANRSLTWTPGFDQSGEYPLTAMVMDPAGLSASQSFRIVVENVNRPPVFEAVANQSGAENSSLEFILSATDPDKEDEGQLTFTSNNLPSGASLNEKTGRFSWTPTFEQSGEYPVTFQVKDSFGETATAEMTVTIANVNRPPVISKATGYDFKENEQTRVNLPEASDPDKEDAGKLTYRMEGLPQEASFNAAARELNWKPTFDQAGEYTATYTVSDGVAEDAKQIQLRVSNVNRPPELQSPGNQSLKEGETLKFKVAASDPDQEDNGKLQFQAKNLPSGAQFDAGSSEFVWTPDNTQQGNYNVEFVVKDGGGLSHKVSILIEVEDVPEEPPTP